MLLLPREISWLVSVQFDSSHRDLDLNSVGAAGCFCCREKSPGW